MLDDGVYASVCEIGELESISKSYVSRIFRLALLAPDLVEAIVEGRADQTLMLEHLERPLPASWDEQRTRIFTSARDAQLTQAQSPAPFGRTACTLESKTSGTIGAAVIATIL